MTEQEVRENGHPPIAEGVVCVDFDGTLHPWVGMFDYPEPIEGGPEFMRGLKAKGYTVVIFTSRLSMRWLMSHYGGSLAAANNGRRAHLLYITDWCNRHDIPFDDITAEKIPAIAYIDDKAIGFDGNWEETSIDFYGGLA